MFWAKQRYFNEKSGKVEKFYSFCGKNFEKMWEYGLNEEVIRRIY
jgi:hypothetical protein